MTVVPGVLLDHVDVDPAQADVLVHEPSGVGQRTGCAALASHSDLGAPRLQCIMEGGALDDVKPAVGPTRVGMRVVDARGASPVNTRWNQLRSTSAMCWTRPVSVKRDRRGPRQWRPARRPVLGTSQRGWRGGTQATPRGWSVRRHSEAAWGTQRGRKRCSPGRRHPRLRAGRRKMPDRSVRLFTVQNV